MEEYFNLYGFNSRRIAAKRLSGPVSEYGVNLSRNPGDVPSPINKFEDRLRRGTSSFITGRRIKRLCHNAINKNKICHTGVGRYPEIIDFTGFRIALRLYGMTKKLLRHSLQVQHDF